MKTDPAPVLQGKKSMIQQARHPWEGQFQPIGLPGLRGSQSRKAAYQGRLAAWRESQKRRAARRRPKKKEEDKKILGLF